ncbi:MAG: 7-carboxy-7-deazaguanine synthase QueE [candidate division WOR-3 bacterium]
MEIPIVEIFESIQGEGKNQGILSIFLRLPFCNLRCSFCDSKYTYENPKFEWKNVKEIFEIIKKTNIPNIVITGGEPLLWQKNLLPLVKSIKKFIEIETNGTIIPLKEFDKYIDQYNVSPKLSNSGEKKEKRLNFKVLKWFAKNKKSYFKYVIDKEIDIKEVIEEVKKLKIDNRRVYLMPCAKTKKELEEKSKIVIKLCKKYNFNYSDRLHIRLGLP